MLSQELDEVVHFASTVVSGGLTVSWEVVDGREAANIDTWVVDFVSGCVHLCDLNGVHRLEFLSELIVLWCQSLAMSAPWSIEFEESVLARLEHILLECLARDHLDRSLHVGRLVVLRLESWGKSAIEEIILKLKQALCGVGLAFEHVLL